MKKDKVGKRYKVPAGMLEAARQGGVFGERASGMLEGALGRGLGWLAEHPVVPTKEQLLVLGPGDYVGWQRVMFLAPVVEVVGVDDLLLVSGEMKLKDGEIAVINGDILEAYSRGKAGK